MEDSDLNTIIDLENNCFVAPWHMEDILYELHGNPVSSLWVIESETTGVVGFIDYWITFDSATICQICTNPLYRNRGLGSTLLTEAIKDCRAHRVRNITLEVRENNLGAIKFYKKFGFESSFVKEKYYTNGDNAIYMIKNLEGDK